MGKLLDKVDSHEDVAALPVADLPQLADEVRQQIVETVSRTGGHLAASLGVVELSVALVHTFQPTRDRLVWDVGHQGYAFKLLTGRRERFETLRQYGGLSGFLNRAESPCDAFGAGHAGTALSAALGMAVARDRSGGDEHVVAIVGDGSLGCGISLEALNNLRSTTERMIVVLNDNEMSISGNVGALSRHFGHLLANPRYNRWKGSVECLASKLGLGWLRSAYYRLEEAVKSLFLRSALFEEMGLRYVGPVDGHNLPALLDALEVAKRCPTPILLHVATRKGKGYVPAEKEPEKWHGAGAFDVAQGEPMVRNTAVPYSNVFGSALERLAQEDDRVVAITAAMTGGTGLSGFARKFPDRFFDVGICEEHAVVFAAGMATRGFVPVFAVYSTFLQRAVDCVIHDVCLQQLPVVLCLDRAGAVGDDGPTHHGVFDLALLRALPGLTLMQPADEMELCQMLRAAVHLGRPVAIRYPRGAGPGVPVPEPMPEMEIGKAAVVQTPADGRTGPVWIWALGDMLPIAAQAASLLQKRGIAAGVVNARFVRPLDEGLLSAQAHGAAAVATLENGVARGGFGSEVEETLVRDRFAGRILRFGWPDEFVVQGKLDALLDRYGLTPAAVAQTIAAALE